MQTLSSAVLLELHKMSSDGAIIWLMAIPEHSIYVAASQSDIAWNGHSWLKFPFELGIIGLDSDGKLPEIVARAYDIDGQLEYWVDQYDGFSGDTAEIYAVHTNCLDSSDAIWSVEFNIRGARYSSDLDVIELSLSIDNPISLRFPAQLTHAELCQYHEPDGFKGTRCGYSGAETTCDRKFSTCISYGNQKRFGAQPGIMGTISDDI